ncbi:SbtR family transcriptional regulator [Nonomuraea rubra]
MGHRHAVPPLPHPGGAGRGDSGALAEGSRALEQAVTDLVAAAVKDGAVRDDVGAGAVMMALHGIGAAHDRPGWRALSRRHPVAAIQARSPGGAGRRPRDDRSSRGRSHLPASALRRSMITFSAAARSPGDAAGLFLSHFSSASM